MANYYILEFTEDFSSAQIKLIKQIVAEEMNILLGIHAETGIQIKFMTMYRENRYVRFSAASDEPRKMWFKINTFQENMEEMISTYLPETMAHEFHHLIRWNYTEKFHLAELMVMEGLAVHFTMEFKGSKKPGFVRPVSGELLKKLLPKIREDLFDEDFDHRIWQQGSEEFGIPASFAYSYGFRLVEEYFQKHPGIKASDCFDVDCREFLPNALKEEET